MKRTNCPGKNSYLVEDLSIQDQKDLSANYFKMYIVPLARSKRVILLNHHDGIHDYCQEEKEEDKVDEIITQVKQTNNNEKENSKCITKSRDDVNDGIADALNALQMDIGAGMNVTIDMLHSSGVEVVKPILKEFILEFSPALSKKCVLKLT